jgi:hypothetical protein
MAVRAEDRAMRIRHAVMMVRKNSLISSGVE